MVELYFPGRHFSAVFGQQSGVPKKPDPSQANTIISQFRCKRDEVIFVGDSTVDIETAKNAGVFALGVSWGFTDKDVLIDCGADAVVDSPKEIIDML